MGPLTFWNDERGITAAEYGLIAGLIAVAVIMVLRTLGLQLEDNYIEVSSSLDGGIA